MKARILAIALVFPLATIVAEAQARDCLKGAAVGGLAGHFAGRHGVLGAAAGCAIAHHRAKVRDREAARAGANTTAQARVNPRNNTAQAPANRVPRKQTTTL
jgi:hypothetical protein